MHEWLIVLLAIVIVIAIIIVIAFVIIRPYIKTDIPLNEPCGDTRLCAAGTTCVNGTCKSDPGGFCNVLSDCSPQSSECIDNICATGEMLTLIQPTPNSLIVEGFDNVYDQQPLPEYANSQSCESDCSRCPSGEICQGSAVILNGLKKYQFGRHKIIDVLELTTLMSIDGSGPLGAPVWILLEDGSIMQDINDNFTTILSNIHPDRLFMISKTVVGATSNGTMYWLKGNNFANIRSGGTLNWNVARWAPTGIVHVSNTLDYEWLWIQSHSGSGSKGYLYSVSGEPSLSKTENMNGRTFRIYGDSVSAYTDVNPVTATGVNNFEQVIPLMVDGAMTSSNQVIRITPQDSTRIWSIRVYAQMLGVPSIRQTDNVYEIQNRLCE